MKLPRKDLELVCLLEIFGCILRLYMINVLKTMNELSYIMKYMKYMILDILTGLLEVLENIKHPS